MKPVHRFVEESVPSVCLARVSAFHLPLEHTTLPLPPLTSLSLTVAQNYLNRSVVRGGGCWLKTLKNQKNQIYDGVPLTAHVRNQKHTCDYENPSGGAIKLTVKQFADFIAVYTFASPHA